MIEIIIGLAALLLIIALIIKTRKTSHHPQNPPEAPPNAKEPEVKVITLEKEPPAAKSESKVAKEGKKKRKGK